MRVLLSAFACAPDIGSEPEVGLRTLLVAARRHEVWVLTQRHMAEATRRFLTDRPERERVHFEVVDPPVPAPRGGLRELATVQWQHDRWQRRSAAHAVALDRRVNFDLVHHVTLAAYWMRAGVAGLDKPLVWGPVGGGVEPPWRLLSQLGARGLLEEATRTTVRRVVGLFPAIRLTQRKSALIFVQNADTARRIRSRAEIAILPNALNVDIDPVPGRGSRTRDVVFAGRLVPWKGARLAVRAMRYIRQGPTSLHIYGDGPERVPVLGEMRRWGVQDRVSLHGQAPRSRILEHVARAAVLLHPSFHEEGGTAVAEALMMGTPVVCLARGGPLELARQWPLSTVATVRPSWPDATAHALAAGIDGFLAHPPPVPTSPNLPLDSFADCVLEAYERAAELGRRAAAR
jgi:glycosyltransferase involved in cell wall biosynthesis